MSSINLKTAREKGKLEEFINEHEKDPTGDSDERSATIKSAVKANPLQKKEPRQKK